MPTLFSFLPGLELKFLYFTTHWRYPWNPVIRPGQGMKTTAELSRYHKIPIPVNRDSLYRVIYDAELLIAAAHGFALSILPWKYCMFFKVLEHFFSLFHLLVLTANWKEAEEVYRPVVPTICIKIEGYNPYVEKSNSCWMNHRELKDNAFIQHLWLIRNDKVCS